MRTIKVIAEKHSDGYVAYPDEPKERGWNGNALDATEITVKSKPQHYDRFAHKPALTRRVFTSL